MVHKYSERATDANPKKLYKLRYFTKDSIEEELAKVLTMSRQGFIKDKTKYHRVKCNMTGD